MNSRARAAHRRVDNRAWPMAFGFTLEAARHRRTEKLEGFKGLDRLTQTVEEERQPLADFAAALKPERQISKSV